MTAIEIIAAVRRHGGDVVVDDTKGARIRKASVVPAEIVALCREHRSAIIAELGRPKPAQLAFGLDTGSPLSFLDQQDALFRAACLGFGLDIGPFVPSRSREAAA